MGHGGSFKKRYLVLTFLLKEKIEIMVNKNKSTIISRK